MTKSPPQLFDPDTAEFTPRFAYGDQAQVAVVSGADGATDLGSGYVRMTDARIPWTIQYDEVILVVEGALSIELDDHTITAGPGQSIWLPAGTALTYISESALLFYAIHPANWAAAKGADA